MPPALKRMKWWDIVTDNSSAYISPSPLLMASIRGATLSEVLKAVTLLKTRVGAKRMWLAEAATINRREVLSAIEKMVLELPEADDDLRFFDGKGIRDVKVQ